MTLLKASGMKRASIIDGRTPSITLNRLLVGIPFASVLIVAGHFWLFALLGMKVEAQLLTYTVVGVIALPVLITSKGRFVREPLFILTVIYVLASLFFLRERQTLSNPIFTDLMTVLLIAAVFSLSTGYRTAITKSILVVFGAFAILGIIQFVILLWFPEAASYASSAAFTSSYVRESVHPLMFLGFTTGEAYTLFGFPLTRLSSFLKEPSLIVPYFVVTGALALSYRGPIKLLALPLLAFALISISGAAWLSIGLSIGMFGVFWALKRSRWLLTVLPLLVGAFLVILTYGSETENLLAGTRIVLDPLKSEATFFVKENAIRNRIVSMKEGLEHLRTSPFGVPTEVTGAGGLIFHALFSAGYIGGALVLWTMREYFSRLMVISSDRRYLMFSVIMYGTLLQALVFTSGGFTSAAGFLLLGLVLTRLREMTKPSVEVAN